MIPTLESLTINRGPIAPENLTPKIESTPRQSADTKTIANAGERTTITSLASQLSDASERAKTTYANYTKQQLKDMWLNAFDLLGSSTYNDNKVIHDTEVPDTQDPTLLERARHATYYANGLGKNPFSGMPRDQLELIIYDDSGSFTFNERRAAFYENSDQEYAWRKRVVDDYFFNKNQPGKAAEFYQTILDHYRGLPLVARSEAPDGYEAKLEKWIEQELNITTADSEKIKRPNKNLSPEIAQKILAQDSSLFKTPHAPEQIGDAPTLDRPWQSQP
ncbi:hypothetical protein [Pseudomonas syringae]|uniref:hypothetical protein n=1 Tax=Pseudomonas syringae TaxID=317 RepID=UPI001F36A56D|nr:hypothetical protein [Pseudomonas syringae]MCF5722227.1 hypothetical protein [Pseudomonas syringae]